MLQRQAETPVCQCTLPDDFEVGSANRQACWDALPTAVKSYVAQLKATLTKRIDDLTSECRVCKERSSQFQAVVDVAWVHRFSDAQEFKVAVLQRAHGCELQRLRQDWDTHRFCEGAPMEISSIYSLDSTLVESILRRLVKTPPLCQNPLNRDAAAVGKRHGDTGWHMRRVLAQVCRLFEALAHTLPSTAFFEVDEVQSAPNAPPGFATRDLERAALARNLHTLVLSLPASERPCLAATAASMLQHCPALSLLTLVLPKAMPAGSGAYCIPQAILKALPSCARLTTLRIFGDAPVQISGSCAAALVGALVAMPALKCVEMDCMAFSGLELAARRFPSALSACKSLREFRTYDVRSPCGWEAITRLPLEVVVIQHWTQHAGEAVGDLEISPSITQLSLFDMRIPVLHEQQLAKALPLATSLRQLDLGLVNATPAGHHALADALPQMKGLRHLELAVRTKVRDVSDDDFARYCAALPCCKSLETLTVSAAVIVDSATWAKAFADAIRACTALTRLVLSELSLLGGNLSLGPLWQVLPECKHLVRVEIQRTKLHLEDVCLLCPVLERCSALDWLAFTDCGLGQASIDMLKWVVSKLNIQVEAS